MLDKVLCILYYFPPIAGVGTQRPLKFIKYMPEFNLCPVVLTVKEGHNFAYDSEMINQVPDCTKIYRTCAGEQLWLRKIIEKISSIIEFDKRDSNVPVSSNSNQHSETLKQGIKDKIFSFIDYNFFIPDSKIRWYKYAVREVRNIIKNEKISYIYSSSAPYTVHLIGLFAKKNSNLPWIADFRDPWSGNVFMEENHSEKRKKKDAQLELEVVTYADKVIMPTEPICKTYRDKYPEYKEKFTTITNGFDVQDFVGAKANNQIKFTICYAGVLSKTEDPTTFIQAMEDLVSENVEYKENISIKFMGIIDNGLYNQLYSSRIKDNIISIPYQPYKECVADLKGAQINMIILPNIEASEGIYSGKIFDYIGAEKPILGIIPENSVAAKLINSRGIGKSFNHGDVGGVYNFIKHQYKLWKEGTNVSTDAMSKCKDFSRQGLTKKLADNFFDL